MRAYEQAVKDEKYHDGAQVTEEQDALYYAAQEFVKISEGLVVNEKLREGLEIGVEVMISCKGGYYYIPSPHFFKYVAPYFELKGIEISTF